MNITTILEEELDSLREEIIRQHEQAGQVATGHTREAFTYRIKGAASAELELPAHAPALERGRGLGQSAAASGSDFRDNLRQWIVARGLDYGNNEKGLERLARFLQWYINTNGTKIFRSGKKQYIYTTPVEEFNRRLQQRTRTFLYNNLLSDIPNTPSL